MTNHRKGISLFERLLFGFARLVALLVAIAAVVGIVLCGMFLAGKFDKPTTVTYQEIESILSPTQEASGLETAELTSISDSYKLPPNVAPYFTLEAKTRLNDLLQELDTERRREDFLNNLSEVISDLAFLEKFHDPENVIKTYAKLKLQRLSQSETDNYAAVASKGVAIGTILWLVLLILLVSFMLVLLAIERHLRIATAFFPTQSPSNPSVPDVE